MSDPTTGDFMNEMPDIKTLAATKGWGRGRVYENITETIGQTPMVKLGKVAEAAKSKANVLLKLEFFNPLSSVKDRIGVAMIDTLESLGKITPGKTTLIEPTSGNTGVSLAFVAAVRGYNLILVMPESMSIERRKIFAHLGAQLILTPASEGMAGAIKKADELAEETDDAVIPGQFENEANPLVHEKTTAEEIWADTGGKVDALVVGIGTGGTLTGCGRVLKKRNPDLKVIAVEPTDSPVLSKGEKGPHKIQGIGPGFVPAILERELIDEIVTVPNEMAFDVSRLLARLEGIPGGISTGANVAAALTIAARDDMEGKNIVTFAPSAADRYMSTELFLEPSA